MESEEEGLEEVEPEPMLDEFGDEILPSKIFDTMEELEEIFQAMRPRQRELVERLRGEEKALATIMHAPDAAEWEVTLQIDKVETTRSALGKARTLMLYRMHRVLTAEQRDALHDLWERRRRSRTPC